MQRAYAGPNSGSETDFESCVDQLIRSQHHYFGTDVGQPHEYAQEKYRNTRQLSAPRLEYTLKCHSKILLGTFQTPWIFSGMKNSLIFYSLILVGLARTNY